jgi:tRNA threonylcarbamoyl adenosine modification protein YeaZ
MLILAFDTTSEKGGVGVFQDAECLALVPNDGPANRFAVTLFEMAQQALTQAHLELRQIELFAVANGPGSFTGIRVGVAAAQAWGRAFARPARGVSVLEALVSKASPASDQAFPILDARRGEFFLGWFSKAGSALDQHFAAADAGWVLKPEALRSTVEERLAGGATATCVVRAHDQVAYALREKLPSSLSWQQVEGTLVDAIAALALRDQQSSNSGVDTKLDAYYIRRPDAETNWKD